MVRITAVVLAIVALLSLVVVGGTMLATQPSTDNGVQSNTENDMQQQTATPGPTSAAERSTGTSTATRTESPTEGTVKAANTATQTATPTRTATATATPTPTATPLEAREVDTDAVAGELAQLINDERSQRGLSSLSFDTGTSESVATMATNHSEYMANQESISHYQGSETSRERYDRNGLYDTCKFQHDGGYIVTANVNQLEVVDRADFSAIHDGGPVTDETHQELASSLLDSWRSDDEELDRLLYTNARYGGIGIAIGDDGYVYATVNIC